MKLHLLSSITLLPPPHDTADDAQVIEDWSRGLDWVNWLLGSVRARMDALLVGDAAHWNHFAENLLHSAIGPAIRSSWQCAHANDLPGLISAAATLSSRLSPADHQRSVRAGAVLLKSTRHARYQAVLGRLREAMEQGRCESHIAIVWAAVGHFFQLSLTNVIAEYLRLEWDIASRGTVACVPPSGKFSIADLTRLILHGASSEAALRVVDA